MNETMSWWQQGVIYQALLPSFYDTNGDGMGDLPGVIEKLDYLQWLGVDALWLSPLYPSPMADLGYDITNYTDIDPRFGTLDDFDTLIREAHGRGLKVILDWVPNHTSSEHPWFQESRVSRENPKRDWYVWRDPKPDGSPPNNWIGVFGGSVWTLDEATGQSYLHIFLEQQPDLNWRNPDVAQALYDAMRFWLDRGVDGFRLDAIDLLVQDEEFRDNPPNPDYDPETDAPDMALLSEHSRNHPGVHEVLAAMRRVVEEYDDRMLAGELYLGIDQIVTYYGNDAPELHLPLNPMFASTEWTPDTLYETLESYLNQVPEHGWPCWMISTHDGRRIASRVGAEQARVAAMLQLTLRGTPVIYYGDEIGMHDVEIPPDREQDPQGKRIGRKRDPVRTPMQWNAEPQASFSTAEPWLPVADDYEAVNVEAQNEPHSMLALYRRLLALRRDEPALTAGTCTLLYHDAHLLAYRRDVDDRALLVVLNLTPEPQSFDLDDLGEGRLLLSTALDRDEQTCQGSVDVRGHEGLLLEI